MDEQKQENVDPPAESPGLRLRPRCRENVQSGKPRIAQSNAERCKAYRARLKDDKERYKIHKELDRERSRQNRQSMSTEQRRHSNELARLRNAKSRAKKKTEQKDRSSPPKRKSHRIDEKSIREKRERERIRKQLYRSKLTPQKKRRISEKRRAQYNDKISIQNESKSNQKEKLPTSTQAVKRLKKLVGKGDRVFAVLRTLIKGSSRAEKKLSQFGLTHSSPTKKKDSLETDLAHTKDRRDFKTLQTRKFLAKTVSGIQRKYKALAYDSRTVTKAQAERKLYAKACKFENDVNKFYEENAIHLSGIKTVSLKTLTQKKVLPTSVQTLYKQYVQEHPEKKISERTFFRRRPKHILSTSKTPLVQCICEVCVNPKLKIQALNVNSEVNMSIDDVLDLSLCVNDGKYKSLKCLKRECDECGLKVIDNLYGSVDSEKIMSWDKWEHIVSGTKKKLGLGT